MIKFLDQIQLEIDDPCYFLINSLEIPHIYIRAKGIVKYKEVEDDVLYYGVKIDEILETDFVINGYIHDKKFITRRLDNDDRVVAKKLKVFDILVNEREDFDHYFSERFGEYMFITKSIDITKNREDLDVLRKNIHSEHKKVFRNGLDDINNVNKNS